MEDLTHDGTKIVIEMNTNWEVDRDEVKYLREAEDLSIIGCRLNIHRDTFPQLVTAVSDELNTFATELVNFINEKNNASTE